MMVVDVMEVGIEEVGVSSSSAPCEEETISVSDEDEEEVVPDAGEDEASSGADCAEDDSICSGTADVLGASASTVCASASTLFSASCFGSSSCSCFALRRNEGMTVKELYCLERR